MDPKKHREYTGVDNSIILENLLALSGVRIKDQHQVPLYAGAQLR